jgi:glutamate/tyrosine decarboxylase-like PLP-dependent enzyme
MMGITQQCTVLLVKDPHQLEPCFATGATYLFQPDKQHGEFDSGDRTFQCARRIDSLKLWLTWKVRGDQGFAERIDHAVKMADHARLRIEQSGGEFAPLVTGDFTNVVFVWVPPELRPLNLDSLDQYQRDRLHQLPPRVKARMQAEGTAMVGFQPIRQINSFRMLFMNPSVTTSDVDAIFQHICDYAAESWSKLSA